MKLKPEDIHHIIETLRADGHTYWTRDEAKQEKLARLAEDADRCHEQFVKLCDLKPEHEQSYSRQLDEVNAEIARKVGAVLGRDALGHLLEEAEAVA